MVEKNKVTDRSEKKVSYVMNFPLVVQDKVLELCEVFSGKVGFDVEFPMCVCSCIDAVYDMVQSGDFFDLFDLNPEFTDSDLAEGGDE